MLSLCQDVLKRGREADLDIAAWDANKRKLMLRLIHEQAKQNEQMRKTLIKYKDQELAVLMGCPFDVPQEGIDKRAEGENQQEQDSEF